MRLPFRILMFLGGFLFLFSASIQACSCIDSGLPCQAFWNTDAVFSGEVKEIIDPPPKEMSLANGDKAYSYQQKKIRFAVEEGFRGVSGETTVEVTTGRGGGDCGYPFVSGEKYLVYAYKNKQTGEFHAGICSRTQLLANAAEDLQYFRSLATKPSGSTVSGFVVQTFPYKNDAPYKNPQPLANIPVIIENSLNKSETKTDEKGAYWFWNLAAGEYEISIKSPDNLWGAETPQKIKVFDKGCARTLFYLQTKTFLSGRLLDKKSMPVTKTAVSLVPIEQLNNSKHYDLKTSFTDDRGRFEFRSIPDGKYYLGIRLSGISDALFPYPQTFYPGTLDLKKARIITITQGQILENYNLKLLKKLRVRHISGIVLNPDGTPAANASIGVNETEYFYSFYYFSPAQTKADGTFSFDIIDGIRYLVKPVGYAPDTPARQRHAEPVELPKNGDVLNLKFVLTEPNGNCEKCFSPKATTIKRP